MAMICPTASSVVMPVFFRLWVSLAETPMQNISTPQAIPRSSPFSLSTSPERTAAAGFLPGWLKCANSLSVSAICGTFSGLTNDPSWMMSMPAASRPSIQAIFFSSGTVCFSICSPSRKPTSWIFISLI